uniref:Uncharacterized protein n=1 Tax=Gadus morhua TaxID=8049 RepID=A0A8C5C9Y2_GADMO
LMGLFKTTFSLFSTFSSSSSSGAPSKARYMFVKCHPLGNDSNCVTHQGPEMNLTTDLPDKLPASAAPYMLYQKQKGVKSPLVSLEESEMMHVELCNFFRRSILRCVPYSPEYLIELRGCC